MRKTINEIRNPYWRRLNVIVAGVILFTAMAIITPIQSLWRGLRHGLLVELPARWGYEAARSAKTLQTAWRGQSPAPGLTAREKLTGSRQQGPG